VCKPLGCARRLFCAPETRGRPGEDATPDVLYVSHLPSVKLHTAIWISLCVVAPLTELVGDVVQVLLKRDLIGRLADVKQENIIVEHRLQFAL